MLSPSYVVHLYSDRHFTFYIHVFQVARNLVQKLTPVCTHHASVSGSCGNLTICMALRRGRSLIACSQCPRPRQIKGPMQWTTVSVSVLVQYEQFTKFYTTHFLSVSVLVSVSANKLFFHCSLLYNTFVQP